MIRQSTVLVVTPLAMMMKEGELTTNIISLANIYETISNSLRKVGYEYQAPLSEDEEQEVITRHIKALIEDGLTPENITNIIIGLNDTTANLAGFTPENIAVDLPEYTQEVREHTDVLDIVTTRIAEGVRASMNTVSKYVKPIAQAMDNQIRANMSGEGTTDLLFNYLNVDMVNVEPQFLNSQFCPSKLPEVFANGGQVNLKDLLKGTWPTMTDENVIRDLIWVDHDALYPFLNDPKELMDVYNNLFANKMWWGMLSTVDSNGDIVDLYGSSHYLEFSKYRSIVIANLIINRLINLDGAFEGVTGVSLNDYRASLTLTRDALTTILVKFRDMWLNKAAAGIVIMDNKVKYEPVGYGVMSNCKMLTGRVSVGYNQTVLDQFSANEESSLSEYIVGYLYAKQRGYQIRDIITDGDLINSSFREYVTDLEMFVAQSATDVATKSLAIVLREFSAKPEYEAMVELLDKDIPAALRIGNAVNEKISVPDMFSPWLLQDIAAARQSFMNTGLASTLCEVFQAPIAAEILLSNAREVPKSEEQQRKILAGSIVVSILKRLAHK